METIKNECYQMIADEDELKWFFDHCIFKPAMNESYSAVFVCRHKKLTEEEKDNLGMAKRDSEFISTQIFRNKTINPQATQEDWDSMTWDFNRFLKTVKRFNVDKGAYATDLGKPLPEKSLVIIFYINPTDDIKVADKVCEKINEAKTSIAVGVLNGKELIQMISGYQLFTKLDSNIKHYKANCKGSKYWMDFDVDVPTWFKCDKNKKLNYCKEHSDEIRRLLDHSSSLLFSQDPLYTPTKKDYDDLEERWLASKEDRPDKYYKLMLEKLNDRFGVGNYVIVDTGGGYHILVRTFVIKGDPHQFCKEVEEIYKSGVADGNPEYLDDKGLCKFEAVINDSQIPGIPLPGTFQYGRPVTVLNKEDFE